MAILIHLEDFSEARAQEVWERNRMISAWHTKWWNVKTWKLMEMILMVFRGFLLVFFNTRNFTRLGTNRGRARKILGMTTRQTLTEDMVLIASPDLSS